MSIRIGISKLGVYLYLSKEDANKFDSSRQRATRLSFKQITADRFEFMVTFGSQGERGFKLKDNNSENHPFRLDYRRAEWPDGMELPHTPSQSPRLIEYAEIDHGIILFEVNKNDLLEGSPARRTRNRRDFMVRVTKSDTPSATDPYSRLDAALKEANTIMNDLSKSIQFFLEFTDDQGKTTTSDFPTNRAVRIRGRRIREDYFG